MSKKYNKSIIKIATALICMMNVNSAFAGCSDIFSDVKCSAWASETKDAQGHILCYCNTCAGGYTQTGRSNSSSGYILNNGCHCAVGYYSTSGNPYENCKACPSNSSTRTTGSTSLSNCLCKSGYYGNASSGCSACPGNKTSTMGNNSTVDFCYCQANYYYNSTTSICTACPTGTTSPSGSTSLSDCKCPENMELSTSSKCVCSKGYYGTSSCTKCPAGTTTSSIGATTASSCISTTSTECKNCQYQSLVINGKTYCSKLSSPSNDCGSITPIGAAAYSLVYSLCNTSSTSGKDLGSDGNLGCYIFSCGNTTSNHRVLNDTHSECLCQKGYYESGSDICSQCPDGLTTESSGAKSILDCKCHLTDSISSDEKGTFKYNSECCDQ